MKKAIVIGSLGFIGYHLCHRLLNEGVEVIAIDAMMNPKRRQVQEEMLLSFGRNAQFQFIHANVLSVDLAKMMKDVDIVFHLANSHFVVKSTKHVSKKIQSTLAISRKIIEACTPKKTAILYTSSLEVYGNRFGTITEASPVSPETAVGLLKVADEALLTQKTRNADIPLLILRLPFVYGPWQHEDSLFYRLFLAQLKGKELDDVELDSSRKENLLYIDDVIEAMWQAANQSFCYEIYNLASIEDNQWNRAMKWFLKRPYERNLPFKPLPRQFSLEKAIHRLNYQPTHTLEEGLQKHQEHFKKMLKHHPALFSEM